MWEPPARLNCADLHSSRGAVPAPALRSSHGPTLRRTAWLAVGRRGRARPVYRGAPYAPRRPGTSAGRAAEERADSAGRSVSQLAEEFRRLRAERSREAPASGWGALPWIFVTGEGRPLFKANFARRVFHPLLKRAGLRRIRFHDLGHTFASRLIQNGESLAYVKEQMGRVHQDHRGHLRAPGPGLESRRRGPLRHDRTQPARNRDGATRERRGGKWRN
jgi:hypothetical protein